VTVVVSMSDGYCAELSGCTTDYAYNSTLCIVMYHVF
jgi:hypothetical protein